MMPYHVFSGLTSVLGLSRHKVLEIKIPQKANVFISVIKNKEKKKLSTSKHSNKDYKQG